MDDGERATGTPDESYAGDDELVGFFAQVQAADRKTAENAKRLLMDRVQLAAR
jgi:hypothetical protein